MIDDPLYFHPAIPFDSWSYRSYSPWLCTIATKKRTEWATEAFVADQDLAGTIQRRTDDGWELFRDYRNTPNSAGLESTTLLFRKEVEAETKVDSPAS